MSDTLHERVLAFERQLILEALDAANQSVTNAARALGVSHQGLCHAINNRHKDLLPYRRPVRVRRKRLIKKGRKGKRNFRQ